MAEISLQKKRIQSIDVVRGIVMVIMALDHVRDYFHITAMTDDPLNLATTTPQLYFTRWITNFCAPVFVFLSGSSIYLASLRKTKAELSSFLLKRGCWLILVEWILISLAWTFDPFYHAFIFQVIWAIGISMVLMGVLIRLPYHVLLVTGLIIVFGHNLLDYPEATHIGQTGFWWDLLHAGRFSPHILNSNHITLVVYPFLPWTGLMLLGYCFGKLYSPGVDVTIRRKLLIRLGFCIIIFFVMLRWFNEYGNPYHWSVQRNGLLSFFDFMNVHKYPPSLLYLCITIGPAMILLALIEPVRNKVTYFFNVFGRVPMFYYILHLYIIHLICLVLFFVSGHTIDQAFLPGQTFGFRPTEFGYSLWIVYLIWILLILVLYPLCKKYDRYKSTHQQWWLSYL